MTHYLIICLAALLGSSLTLFSGFGLGTILVPVFALFFPIDLAIALTAIVHFLNNIFKLSLLGKNADKKIVIAFGVPSIITAFLGAYILTIINNMNPIAEYHLFNSTFYVLPLKLIIALLLIFFSLFEIIPTLSKLQFDRKYLPLGGLLGGFLGGLSGHQGALRSAFLMRSNLSKESFIATGVVIACLIDLSRLTVYAKQIFSVSNAIDYTLITFATLSAFTGAYIGNKLLKKTTIKSLHYFVSIMLLIFSILLGLGII